MRCVIFEIVAIFFFKVFHLSADIIENVIIDKESYE